MAAVPFALAIAAGIAAVASGRLPPSFLAGRLSRSVSQSEGLSTVYEDKHPEVDIVCVHGLGGDPNQTWEWREGGRVVNWTKELLHKEIKNIRVLTYGYSSKLFTGARGQRSTRSVDGKVLKYLPQALYLHSNRLIEQLADARVGNAGERPVIFVAHSLGGLIVKSALVYASAAVGEQYQRLKAIELLTVGVLFFGTPQRELDWNRWSELLGKMFRIAALTPLDAVIQPLREQAELFNLQVQRYKSIESNFLNFSFCEKIRSAVRPNTEAFIVRERDAIPSAAKSHDWEKFAFNRTHSDLVKFDSEDNPDFIQVVRCLRQCMEDGINRGVLERYRKFLTWSSKAPYTGSETMEQEDNDEWVRTKSRLYRVDSSDSKEDVSKKQKSNKDFLTETEETNGLCGWKTLLIVDAIAHNALEAREYESAEAWYKRLFVAVQEKHTPFSEETVNVLKKVADVTERQGRLVEATDTLSHARKLQRKWKADDPDVLQLSEKIASLLWSRDLLDEAIGEYEHLIADVQKGRKETDTEVLRLKRLVVFVWRQKGKKDPSAAKIALKKENEIQRLEDRLKHDNINVA